MKKLLSTLALLAIFTTLLTCAEEQLAPRANIYDPQNEEGEYVGDVFFEPNFEFTSSAGFVLENFRSGVHILAFEVQDGSVFAGSEIVKVELAYGQVQDVSSVAINSSVYALTSDDRSIFSNSVSNYTPTPAGLNSVPISTNLIESGEILFVVLELSGSFEPNNKLEIAAINVSYDTGSGVSIKNFFYTSDLDNWEVVDALPESQGIKLYGPEFSLTSDNVNFDAVDRDSGVYTNTITVSNTGDQSLFITEVNSDDTQVTVSPTTAFILAGSSKVFDVIFEPVTEGVVNATINFISSDENLGSFSLSSEVLPLEPLLILSTTEVAFGDYEVGDSEPQVSIVMSNGGKAELKFGQVLYNCGDPCVTIPATTALPAIDSTLAIGETFTTDFKLSTASSGDFTTELSLFYKDGTIEEKVLFTGRVVATILAPTAPQNFFVEHNDDGKFEFTWNNVAGANNYRLYGSNSQNDVTDYFGIVNGTSKNLALDEFFTHFYVSATNSGGESAKTEFTGVRQAKPFFTTVSHNRLVLEWPIFPEATYELKRATSFSGPYQTVYTGSDNGYSDLNLAIDTSYYYTLVSSFAGFDNNESDIAVETTDDDYVVPIVQDAYRAPLFNNNYVTYDKSTLIINNDSHAFIEFDKSTIVPGYSQAILTLFITQGMAGKQIQVGVTTEQWDESGIDLTPGSVTLVATLPPLPNIPVGGIHVPFDVTPLIQEYIGLPHQISKTGIVFTINDQNDIIWHSSEGSNRPVLRLTH